MSTPRRITYEYAANPDAVFALLHDKDFLRQRAEAAGETNIEVTVEEVPDGFRVVVARDKEVELPAFAKRMFKPQNRIVDDTTWRRQGDNYVASYQVQVAGIPGEVKGKSTLIASAKGCQYESNFEVTARIPIVGGKLEGIVADRIEETFRANAERNAKQFES
ncbi:MAG: hypothetical protein JWN04_4739 [Myxococcaceae bacterium]|nr:hypothetical protein [Myxococcaceae bacterium]